MARLLRLPLLAPTKARGHSMACRALCPLIAMSGLFFERPGDPPITPNINDVTGAEPLQYDSPEVSNAFRMLGLRCETD
jgi:hypothetical protein